MSSFADIFLHMMRDMQSMIRGCGVSRGDAGVSLSAENDTGSFSLSGQDARPIQPRVAWLLDNEDLRDSEVSHIS